tara:strand:- start:330 stop:482 length:153 start_codon:yes stop_codon:yes gene_type:complete
MKIENINNIKNLNDKRRIKNIKSEKAINNLKKLALSPIIKETTIDKKNKK